MFKDHFSKQARDYSRYRPGYPEGLFRCLAGLSADRGLAWDCGTGSGQAAVALGRYYRRVIATDPSPSQVANAQQARGVEYRVCPAEKADLPDGCADLITVAQALHWFDVDRFYEEARRVGKAGGILAVWGYGNCRVDRAVDEVFDDFYHRVVGPFWPPERRHIDEGYARIPFPFEVIPVTEEFAITETWDLDDYLGYLGTWSAVQAYRKEKGEDPLASLEEALLGAWGDRGVVKEVRWPIFLKVGRI